MTIGVTGDTETRPANMAMDYYVKAVNDAPSGGAGTVTGITSSDTNAIDIDSSDPAIPELVIKTNIAFGLVKLDGHNKVPNSLLDVNLQTWLGTYDASSNT